MDKCHSMIVTKRLSLCLSFSALWLENYD